jgi:DnaA-homolog protein
MPQQLPLGIGIRPSIDFSSFIVGRNGEALSHLRSQQDPFLYLWGESGCGKSHLLQAACAQAHAAGRQPAYLPLKSEQEIDPAMLDGLEGFALVCLDDLECIAGNNTWEQAIFNLFNLLRERGVQLLVSANRPPSALAVALPDLASRLTWGPCYHLLPLDDNDRLELLMRSAERRGMRMSPETANFLLQRTPRDIHFLSLLMDRLDKASMAAQRRLTIPFVRKTLNL